MSQFNLCAIVVNWNCLDDVIECASRLNPTPVIVVDNASSNRKEVVSSISALGCTLVLSDENRGYGGGMNLGMARAREMGFSHALLINPDTVPGKGFVAAMSERVGDSAVLGVRQHHLLSDGTDAGPYYSAARMSGARPIPVQLDRGTIEVDVVTGAAMLVDLDAVSSAGFMDERFFHYKEEFDLVYRLKREGYIVRYTADVILPHRLGASLSQASPTAEYYRARNEILFIRRRFSLFHLLGVPGFWIDCARRARPSALHRKAVLTGVQDGLADRDGKHVPFV
jgi:GT2 family glycosyltransferase